MRAIWGFFALAASFCCIPLHGQATHATHAGSGVIAGAPDDWTHHRVVYSNAGTAAQAIEQGRYAEWLRIVNDPRYVIHQLKRGLPLQAPLAPEAVVEPAPNAANDAASIEARDVANRKSPQDQVSAQFRRTRPMSGPLPDPRFRIPDDRLRPVTDLNQDWNEPMGNASAPSFLAYPAKWSFDTTAASCANDFVVYPTGQPGSGSQASIVAYYNLYTGGCSGTVPETDWAYNTGGTVALSPVFSLTGNQLAFIQTSGGVASLVLLQIPLTPPGAGTLSAPAAPNVAASASNFYTLTGCPAPCMYSMTLSGSGNDTASSPYYDYASDMLWVGDSAGQLHEFTPVFNGPPAEIGSNWPVLLFNGAGVDNSQTTSPVYDSVNGNVFVGTTTSASRTTGGFLYSIDAATGAIAGASNQLDATNGLRDAPLLDPVAGMLYVFAGRDTGGQSGVFQFATSFTNGGGTEIQLGTGGTGPLALQSDGAFDNTYYTSSSAASPSGYLYVCPNIATPRLYQIPITGNFIGAAIAGPKIGGSGLTGRCSPISEFYNTGVNGGTDLLLLSVFSGTETGCTNSSTNGCVMSFDVTNPANWSTALPPLGTLNISAPGNAAVTGGIVVDNNSTMSGASQMYFLTQYTGGTTPCAGICAVQLSQSAP